MREYQNTISLIKNGRGVYCLDTTIGCNSGMSANEGGCYNDCYAAKSAKQYGYDFSKTVLREFKNESHRKKIVLQISRIDMPFVRIGCSGDPSENWDHTLSVIDKIKHCNKEIVIITRHWNLLTDSQLSKIGKLNICINTSVSALDNTEFIERAVSQFERVKPYCKSVLRIVSANFNIDNTTGLKMNSIQDWLFSLGNNIDTVFRPSAKNKFVTDNIILTKNGIFNGHKAIMSKRNKKTYTGKCAKCQEMCGVNILHRINPMPISIQGTIFKK